MKKIILLLGFVLTALAGPEMNGQVLMHNSRVTGVCYAGNKVHRIYIPPRMKPSLWRGSKGGGRITVNYSGFTSQAKSAVEYAVGILENMLPPDLKMTVNASWIVISTNGVLGNSAITSFVGGWDIDAFKPKVYYPVTVAEKIAGRSLNGDTEADVQLDLNKSINWYYGTDGTTPPNKYDLVTVVLHELCHGLGFFDSMGVNGTEGYFGISGLPVIYDTFIENDQGNKLIDTTLFPQNSSALYHQLTGGHLFFNGPLTFRYMAGSKPKLYAPSTWDPGSSISHLDETQTLDVNSLMTPYIDLGEAIHDPGNMTLSMLGDLGWINTRIIHPGKKDTEEHLASVDLSVSIKSDTLYNKSNVSAVYSYDSFTTSNTLILSPTTDPDKFSGTVAVPSYNTKLSYYFTAIDNFERVYKVPSLAEEKPYTIYIGIDTIKPVILHTPADYYFEKIDSIHLDATVTDNLAVDTVFIEFNVNGGQNGKLGLTDKGGDKYSGSLDVKPLGLKGGDHFNYRIVAVDSASGHNTKYFPPTGYQVVNIESLLPVVESYSTDFSNSENDFFNTGFSIAQPEGFNSPALHSDHPYRSPDEDNKQFNFTSVLRHPVIFDANGMTISFRELVLVEPGETGSLFGSPDFYDYVIVEGSKDFGKKWFALVDGYDCRINSSWEGAYNSSTDGMNSTFVGNESLMVNHVIYPKVTDKISNGDSMLVRFRLFSDPYGHGWGWVVDDLKVQRLIDKVENIQMGTLRLYPNPGNGHFMIASTDNMNIHSLTMSIFNSSGQCIVRNRLLSGILESIDISDYPSGLYFVVIRNAGTIKTFKYSLIR